MTPSEPGMAQIVADPVWLMHRYDDGRDAFHFIHADRGARSAATFLTDQHLQPGAPVVLGRDAALALAPPAAPVHFIFHSAYCCSTLLARALDMPGIATTLKEPVLFNDLVGWRHRGGAGRDIAMVLDHGLRLLARPFGAGEAVIVKPSNVANALIAPVMAMRPTAHALFLYAPLEQYLSSIARKGMWSRIWVRELLVKLLRDGLIQLGLDETGYLQLTDLQAAAVGWLAQQAHFAALLRSLGPQRARSLNSEEWMADPHTGLAALARHFGLTIDATRIDAVLAGPAFTTDSKTGAGFGPDQRDADRQDALAIHGEEIAMVLRWAKEIATRFGIPMALEHRLVE